MREALVTSAIESAQQAMDWGLAADQIVLSAKVSGVQDLIAVYRELAKRSEHPLHLGLTEAGMGSKGIVSSTAAMSVLLQEGIGDTIRVSLTPEPGGDRRKEVVVAQEMLQVMGLRAFTPLVIACPGCGRTRRPSSRNWLTRCRPICVSRCPSGAASTRRGVYERRRDGLRGQWPRREQAR